MALIKCPDCGRELSSEAQVCPQCGRTYPGITDSARNGWGAFGAIMVPASVIVIVYAKLVKDDALNIAGWAVMVMGFILIAASRRK